MTLAYAPRGLIGVLTPQANTTVEPEFWIMLPPGVAAINARMVSPKEALEARKMVERAKGILMRRFHVAEDEAHRRLQKMSRDRCQSMKQTAEQVLAAAEILGT